MKKRFLAALLSIFTILAATPVATSFAADALPKDKEATLIVELTSPAVLEADLAKLIGAQRYNNTAEAKNAQKQIKQEQAEIFSRIKKICPSVKKCFSYTHTLNGFSIEAHIGDIDAIKALDGVKNVTVSEPEPIANPADDEEVTLAGEDEPKVINPCCEEIGADYMHANGYRGQGRVVAVIDSEFDTSHDIFQGEISNPKYSKADIKKIIDENELNVDVTASGVYRNTKIPFAYNYFMKSTDVYKHESWVTHGTHVAGIAAGNNGKNPDGSIFESVAPEAQLILMCISSEDGSLGNVAIIGAAIDDAAKMGVDAINLSLGTAGKYFKAMEECVNRAANAGIIISVSAGNEGRGYNFRNPWRPENIDYGNLGSPSFVEYSTSVASIETNKVWDTRYNLRLGEDLDITTKIGRTNTLIYDKLELDKNYEYVYCGSGGEEDFEKVGDLTGKIALIQRETFTFAETSANAQNKNALAVIYINRTTDEFKDLTFSNKLTIPMCFVKNEDGEKLKSAETKTVSLIKKEGWFDNNAKGMSTFSSWAVDNNLNLKPEITAPGSWIYSSIYNDGYDFLNGTSMATPHITGAAALMYQYIDANYSEEQYKDIGKRAFAENLMMSAASICYVDEENNIAASPRQQGAGLLNLENAAKTPVYLVGNPGADGLEGTDYGKSKISVKEIGGDNNFTLKFKAVNFTDNPVEYNNISVLCQTDDVDADGNIGDTIPFKVTASGVPKTVTVAANSSEEISIEMELDDEAVKENLKTFVNGFWIDGFVILKSDDENVPEISIPYSGFCGDWTAAPIFDKPYYSGDSVIGDTALYSNSSSGGRRILGTNLMAEKIFEGEELKKYCGEKYVGISPNGDEEFDDLLLYYTPLRRIDYVSFAVKKDDVEIFSANNELGAGVKYAQVPSTLSGFYYSDGDYTAELKSWFAYEGSEEESVTFKFYIDTEMPEIISYGERYDEETGKTFLDVTARDNRYLMGVAVLELPGEDESDEDESEEGELKTIMAPFEPQENAGEERTVSIDITGFEKYIFIVYDYALNSIAISNSQTIKIKPLGKVSVGINNMSLSVDTFNRSENDIIGDIMAVLYDENYNLLDVDICRRVDIPIANSVNTFKFKKGYNPDYKVRFFVWDSIEGMSPICEKQEYGIEDWE